MENNFEDVHRKYELKSDDIVNMLSGDNRFNDAVKDSIADAYNKLDGNLTADILVDNSPTPQSRKPRLLQVVGGMLDLAAYFYF